MNKTSILFGVAAGIATLIVCYRDSQKASIPPRNVAQLKEHLNACGFSVSTDNLEPNQVIRFRGGYEELMKLAHPDRANDKPPLPTDLDINRLPKYHCGCPHCGKMSTYGENQWRYQELSRTRGPWDNTTTFLVKCQACDGFMKSTVDHDD